MTLEQHLHNVNRHGRTDRLNPLSKLGCDDTVEANKGQLSGSLVKLYLPGGQKHQIWHNASEGHNKKIHPLSQREFPSTLA